MGEENIHVSGDPSPVCKRHQESVLKGIQSYLCLVQTGHVGTGEKNYRMTMNVMKSEYITSFTVMAHETEELWNLLYCFFFNFSYLGKSSLWQPHPKMV